MEPDCAMLKSLAGGNRLVLKEGRRSDSFLFDFYSRLAVGGCYHLPLQEQVALARQTFPKQHRDALFNLCISHQKRQQIIRDIQKRELAQKREAGADVAYLAPVCSSTANKNSCCMSPASPAKALEATLAKCVLRSRLRAHLFHSRCE